MTPDSILFDFDGVIVDSMHIRDFGYREIVKEFSPDLVDRLVQYHRSNAGLSRYVKIRYFYENLLGKEISVGKVNELAEKFSLIMKAKLTDPSIIIEEAILFIKKHYTKLPLHIVSGSDQDELRYICKCIDIDSYFLTIEGSPTSKTDLVSGIISSCKYNPRNTILIGDSINDYDAAKANGLIFYAYNNDELRKSCNIYLDSFDEIFFN